MGSEGLNPFLLAATPLLTLTIQVKHCQIAPDVDKLHQQAAQEVKIFINKLQQLKFSSFTVNCASYCLCAALDEAVLATRWGTQSIWVQNSLLSVFNQETWGGERFYTIADTLARDPRKHLEVLELIYTLMSLGFQGKFFGKKQVLCNEIRNRLYQKIRHSRGKVEKLLSLHWIDEQAVVISQKKNSQMKRLIVATLSAVLVLLITFNWVAYHDAREVLHQLHGMAHESPVTAYSQLLKRSIFPQSFQ